MQFGYWCTRNATALLVRRRRRRCCACRIKIFLRAFHWIRVHFMLHFSSAIAIAINRCRLAWSVFFRFSFVSFIRAFWFSLVFMQFYVYALAFNICFSFFHFFRLFYSFLFCFCFWLSLYSEFLLLIFVSLFLFEFLFRVLLFTVHTDAHLNTNSIYTHAYHLVANTFLPRIFIRLLIIIIIITLISLFLSRCIRVFIHNLHLYDAFTKWIMLSLHWICVYFSYVRRCFVLFEHISNIYLMTTHLRN